MLRNLKLFTLGIWVLGISSFILFHAYRVKGPEFRDGQTVPYRDKAGVDFEAPYTWVEEVLSGNFESEKPKAVYPPAAALIYLPFRAVDSYTGYKIFTVLLMLSLFGMLYLTIHSATAALVGSLLFYNTMPVAFSLERGNSDLIIGFVMAAVLVALERGAWKTVAGLLTFAIQYKVYPVLLGAIFLLRAGWKWLAGLVVVNVALLFIMGKTVLDRFLFGQEDFNTGSRMVWEGNHSLFSFADLYIQKGRISESLGWWISDVLPWVLVWFFALAWLVARISKPYPKQGKLTGSEIGLIGMLVQLMSLLPHVSHDYRLVIQLLPFFLVISREPGELGLPVCWAQAVVAILATSLAVILGPLYIMKTPCLLLNFAAYGLMFFLGQFLERKRYGSSHRLAPGSSGMSRV